MSDREGHHFFYKPDKIFSFACEYDFILAVVAVKKRAYSDRVAGCYVFIGTRVVNYESELRVQHFEHVSSVFAVHGQQYFAVRLALECVSF